MTRHERNQLRLALRAARVTRGHAYSAALAAPAGSVLAVRLQRVHLEACALESELLQTLLTFNDAPTQEQTT